MPGVTCRAVADRAVAIGPADGVALLASAGHRRAPFKLYEGMGWSSRASGLISLGKIHLLGREPFFTIDRSPGGRGMTTVKELLVNALVTTAAIARREFGRDYESVMIFFFLSRGRLMALQAVHTFTGMSAHFILVNHRILRTRVTLGAFAGSANQSRRGLLGFTRGPGPINNECSQNESESDYYCDKNRAEGHCHGDPPTLKAYCIGTRCFPGQVETADTG